MKKEICQLIGEITSLAVLITEKTEADIFVDYAAHVKALSIKVYPKGWSDDEVFINYNNYLNKDYSYAELVKVKRQLIKIVIKGHVDLTKFPYEIETIEIKNYKLI